MNKDNYNSEGVVRKFSHQKQDEYYTPAYAVKIILPYIETSKVIWCPFDTKDSNFVKLLKLNGNKVIHTHIKYNEDFLNYRPTFEWDLIISNPPFSLKQQILKKCLDYNKPFALLLPFTMFNSIKTVQVIKDGIQFLIMDRRISFNGERPNFTCWYVCHNLLPKDVIIYQFKQNPLKLYKQELNEVLL
jgi:hypothetical protein